MMKAATEVSERVLKALEEKGIKREDILGAVNEAKRMAQASDAAHAGEVDRDQLEELVLYAAQMLKQVCDLDVNKCDSDPKFGLGILTGIALMFDSLRLPAVLTGDGVGLIASAANRFQRLAAEHAVKSSQGVKVENCTFCTGEHGHA